MPDFLNPLTSQNSANGATAAASSAPKILVVEDDPDLALLTCMSLKKAGYEVAVANDARQALEALSGTKPDLVVLDVMLPEVDGFELLASLKSHHEMADVPVMMMSAVSEDSYLAQGHRLGAEYYLKKPFLPSQLIAAVKGVFATVRMRQRIESAEK